ncbi:MAG: hypothetical protein JO022_08020 [Acidobacteriaceae bacterium]|nr:hypothetical protein [Acidobacteriaceae bacterium]
MLPRQAQGVQAFAPQVDLPRNLPVAFSLLPPALPETPAPVFQEPPGELPAAALDTGTTSQGSPFVPGEPAASPQLKFRLSGTLQANFDSNIFIQQNHAQSDLYFIFAPIFALGGGRFTEPLERQAQSILQPQDFTNTDLIRVARDPYYFLSYTPSYTAFVDHTNLNSFDNDVAGGAQVNLQRLTLGAFARFQTFRVPDIDVGTRVVERWTSARAYTIYQLSDRTQLSSEFFLQNRDYQNFIGSLELWTEDWIDYSYSSKTNLGAGIAGGIVIPSAGPQEYYGRIQGRATWRATSKITVAAKAGVELRTVHGAGEKTYPVFGLEARYAITNRILASLSVYQEIRSSADQAALIYVGRGVNVGVEGRIADRYLLSTSVGYSNTDYDNSFMKAAEGTSRTDNFVFANSVLQIALSRKVHSQVGVELRKNQSSRAGSSFNEALATWALHVQF